MSFNFPDSPTVGLQTSYGNRTWEWNGNAWKLVATYTTIQGIQGVQGLSHQGTQGIQGSGGIQGKMGPVAGSNRQIIYNNNNSSAGAANFVYNPTNQRVGIGTTNPQYDLDVDGDINFNGSFYQNGSAFVASRWTTGIGDDIYRLNGDVGIGTTNPTTKLQIQGDVSIASTVGIGTIIDIVPYDTLNSGTLSFEGSAGQLFSITNNLTAGSIFSVNDVSGIPSIDINADGTLSLVSYGGSIGIGTTRPTRQVDITGSVRLRDGLYDSNNNVGAAGSTLVSTGTGVSWTTPIQGVQGTQSTQGILGAQGTAGSSVRIVGSIASKTSGIGSTTLTSNDTIYSWYPPTNGDGVIAQDTGDLWVFDGVIWNNVGTVRGPQGLQGLQGVQGLSNQGTQGLQGNQGTQGPQGMQGTGNQGLQGLQGNQGTQGLQGRQGTQGLQGNQGTQGLQGFQGTQGFQGLQGAQGIGNQGLQGTSSAAGSGSGTFDTGITTSIYVSVTSGIGIGVTDTNNIFTGPGIAYSFPSTAGRDYVIESIHVTNIYSNELYLVGRQDYSGGSNVPLVQRVIVPYQGATELLEQPIIASPSDIIRFQAMDGFGSTAAGVDGGLDAFIVYSTKTDTNYVGVGKTVTSPSGTEIYTSTTYPTVVQSIRLVNYNLNIDIDASVSIYKGGTVGGIVTTGVRNGYLVYNLTVPKNSTIEICERPKYLAVNDTLVAVGSTINSLAVHVSGKYIV